MSWHGNGYRLSSGLKRESYGDRLGNGPHPHRGASLLARSALGGLGLVAALAGCALSPPVTKSGLPRVARYTSPAQLDWMLGRYQAIGQAATGAPGGNPELQDEACLGWERAVFDLESARRYPMLLRMSTETTGLVSLWQDLPTLARRHPRPSVCTQGVSSPQDQVPSPVAPTVANKTLAAVPPEPGEPVAPGGPVASAPANASAPAATAASGSAPPAPEPSPAQVAPLAATPPGALPPESSTAKQRRLLARLATALNLSLDPGAREADPGFEPGIWRPGPRPAIDGSALSVLTELAQSDVPPIRLRARFHLLGLCILAVEDADRYFNEPKPSGPSPAGSAGVQICGPLRPDDSLRHGQGRLLWSLLGAWRAKYPEPMSDLVLALASFASRDNPVVPGPRVSR